MPTHSFFSPSLASFTSLRLPSLFSSSSPQQLINAAPSPSIIHVAFLLYFPSHTAREQHFPCIPCTTNTNLFPKMIKSAAFINECDGWINSRTLISESGIHTKYTTIESLFGHSLSGYKMTCDVLKVLPSPFTCNEERVHMNNCITMMIVTKQLYTQEVATKQTN